MSFVKLDNSFSFFKFLPSLLRLNEILLRLNKTLLTIKFWIILTDFAVFEWNFVAFLRVLQWDCWIKRDFEESFILMIHAHLIYRKISTLLWCIDTQIEIEFKSHKLKFCVFMTALINFLNNIFFFCRIMSLPGLPPLPKSLSGLELTQQQQTPPPSNNYHNLLQLQQQQLQQQQVASTLNSFDSQRSLTSSSSSSISRKNSTLDTQLAVLRREMVSFNLWLILWFQLEVN